MNNHEKALGVFLDMGRIMMENGSDVHRIEQTLILLGKAYGAEYMDVLAITSSIIATMKISREESYTHTRRITASPSTNFRRLENINELSRQYCSQKLSLAELETKLAEVKAEPVSQIKILLGEIIAAGSFALFFGGSINDGVVASLLSIFVWFMQKKLSKICNNIVFFNFFCTFLTGVFALLICNFAPFELQIDKIIIGDIMILIPGLAMCNALKDIFVGDTITGIMRFAETILWAGALAFGFATAVLIGKFF